MGLGCRGSSLCLVEKGQASGLGRGIWGAEVKSSGGT